MSCGDPGEPGGGGRPLSEAQSQQLAAFFGKPAWVNRLRRRWWRRRFACAFQQPLERLHAQTRGVIHRSRARRPRDPIVVRAVRKQAGQRIAPGGDVLRRHFRERGHLLVELGSVCGDGIDGQKVRHAHLSFGDAAHRRGHHGYAAEHGLQHHAGARFGPQGRHEQDARAREQLVVPVEPGDTVSVP
ncbi:MAG: hypothetical protein ACLQHT_23720 [Terracidiphilus sp.]